MKKNLNAKKYIVIAITGIVIKNISNKIHRLTTA